MRYNSIDNITFTDYNGDSFLLKDIRPIPNEAISFSINPSGDIDLDEVASRKEVYGDLAEDQSYRIFDANIVKLVENDFNNKMLNEIKIPL